MTEFTARSTTRPAGGLVPGTNGHAARLAPPGAAGPVAKLADLPAIQPAAAGALSAEDAVRLRAVPVCRRGAGVLVAMVDPGDFASADEVSILTGRPVEPVGVTEELFEQLLRTAFGATAAQMAARLGGAAPQPDDLIANLQAVDAEDVRRMAEQPTLINLVNLIILEAVRERASDVHVEPFERKLTVKYRVDGLLREESSPPKHLQAAITSRIKIMAGMNIAERYVPQDGHISLRFEGRKVDIRVSTVPTIYGESVVMRILDKEAITLDLVTLGMRESDRAAMDRLLDLPHGMVLVTGPTGSGKTTTLYAALTKLYDPSLKIITIEDPVEYELAGINQIPVNPDRGLTFASGLRSILRQDPDVIMVGEIRDNETADIAIRAALTGHLIFSTLHTNDAASAIGRLLDMDVEPFLVASVIEGVLAQRLGRKLCAHCRARGPFPEALAHRLSRAELGLFPGGLAYAARGCDECENVGFRGRIGFYEMLLVTTPMREAITGRRTSRHELLRTVGPGYVTMRQDGLIKAALGQTTVDEVLRATQDADDPLRETPTHGPSGAGGVTGMRSQPSAPGAPAAG
ncbi:MAG TPA: GspE/PulE family protein [Phycisphaerales bacterium]|nr:GspE/PulE family protein [Phycisphaerales bacterium]